MFENHRKTTLATVLPLVVLGLGTGLVPSLSAAAPEGDKAANDKPAAGLSLAEFTELKSLLDVKNQPWTTIPWKYSITEARKEAAAANKPIFMVVNTGNALGCT